MSIATHVFILLLLVAASSYVARAAPRLPAPFVQIALGAAAAGLTGGGMPIDPEAFLFLFVPPLLFLDGWRIPNDELLAERGAVLRMAFGLVVFTVLGVGSMVHAMIPAIPWPVAFALAAVVSPTDPVAVSAIAGRVGVPPRMMRILQGEALLNDASGLSSLRVAVAAVGAGGFSVLSAGSTFLWMAAGGAAIGAAVGLAAVALRDRVAGRLGEDAGASILTALLIPFAAYLLADAAGCSGVLAAAAAGIAVSVTIGAAAGSPATRVRSRAVWDMLAFVLNGATFTLLGEQLPTIAGGIDAATRQAGAGSGWALVGYVVAIVAALGALRFAWVWTSLRVAFRRPDLPREASGLRAVAATTVAGAKGAVTLAAALSLPLTTEAGAPFPARDLAVLLAAGVILLSLGVAAAGLPALLKGVEIPPDEDRRRQRRAAHLAAARAALAALGEEGDPEARAVAEHYRRRVRLLSRDESGDDGGTRLRSLRRAHRAALHAEREAVAALVRSRKIGIGVAGEIVHGLDLEETRFGGDG